MRLQIRTSSGLVFLLAASTVLMTELISDCPAATDPPSGTAKVQVHKTPYYDIHSDLKGELVREAAARLTAMAEEYHRRTKGLSQRNPPRMPFYLLSNKDDYYAAGGSPGTTGMCFRHKLIALVPRPVHEGFWRTVQHEGFHQFAHHRITQKMPVWLDEGLAEYFELGIWTGDGFVTGLIPPVRLKRVKKMIAEKKLRPFEEMIDMTRSEWNTKVLQANYDQAWSMVHFMIQGEGGKYQQRFAEFVNDVAGYRSGKMAFKQRFGGDLGGFQRRYCTWWSSLSDNPTKDEYDRATVQTLTSFFGRAYAQGQKFLDAEALMQAGRDGDLKCDVQQWLPPSLLESALKKSPSAGQWSLTAAPGEEPQLVLRQEDGVTFTGTFEICGSRVREVKVTLSRVPETPRRSAGSRPQRGE